MTNLNLKGTKAVILRFMADGEWHKASEIRRITGGQSECLRRMRELRKFVDIEVVKVEGSRNYRYRMKPKKYGQWALFL